MAKYFYFCLSIRTFGVNVIPAVKFLNHMLSFLNIKGTKEAISKHLNFKIHLDLYVYTSYVNYELFKRISLRFNQSTESYIWSTLLT